MLIDNAPAQKRMKSLMKLPTPDSLSFVQRMLDGQAGSPTASGWMRRQVCITYPGGLQAPHCVCRFRLTVKPDLNSV